ncbi:MAG: hypothetical protein KAX36_09600, partial [Thermoflexales bacterium]|nr:hypothetical protein [Thermoflexales bacterium]
MAIVGVATGAAVAVGAAVAARTVVAVGAIGVGAAVVRAGAVLAPPAEQPAAMTASTANAAPSFRKVLSMIFLVALRMIHA